MALVIRQETPADRPAVDDLVSAAFGQDVEARLVDAARVAGLPFRR